MRRYKHRTADNTKADRASLPREPLLDAIDEATDRSVILSKNHREGKRLPS